VVTEATGSVRRRWCSPSGRGPARPRRYATGSSTSPRAARRGCWTWLTAAPGCAGRLAGPRRGLESQIVTATLDPFRGYLTALADQWEQELTGVLGAGCWPHCADNE
jgi:hypothetical protein